MRTKNLLVSLIMIVGIAIIALAGLLLGMNYLAAPAPPPATPAPPNAEPTASPVPPPATAVLPDNAGDVAAIVNGQTITGDEWNRATRLDTVMSHLAGQPLPTAEETLDRLINEILILEAVPNLSPPAATEAETRLAALITAWHVSETDLQTTLANNNLTRADLTNRLIRLIQVETALEQLAAQGQNIDTWLGQARARAEIGLYQSLTAVSAPVITATVAPTPPAVTLLKPDKLATLPGPDAPPPSPTPQPAAPTSPYAGNLAPDFSLPALDDSTITLNARSGRPVLINFWASWCPPCRAELPALQAAYTQYGDSIGFVAVNVKESGDTVAAFVKEMGLTFPVAFDSDGQIAQLYEVRGLPTTIFVAADGTVSARHVGPLDEAAIDTYLQPLLAQAGPEQTPAPGFSLTSASGDTVSLADYRNRQNVVLVFYRGQT